MTTKFSKGLLNQKMPVHSPNFSFLAGYDERFLRFAALAERYVFDDPNSALIKLRQFAELLAHNVAARIGLIFTSADVFLDVLNTLSTRGVIGPQIAAIFHGLRKAGNTAAHSHVGNRDEALHQLRMAYVLSAWFHKNFGLDPTFQPAPFLPPPKPADAEQELVQELDRLRLLLVEMQQKTDRALLHAERESDLRLKAEERALVAYRELGQALQGAPLVQEEPVPFTTDQLAPLRAQANSATPDELSRCIHQLCRSGEAILLDIPAKKRLFGKKTG